MTPQQAVDWRDFSRRMAWVSHQWRTPERRRRVCDVVDDLIECFIRDWGLDMIGSWDGGQVDGTEGKVTQRYGRDHLEIAYPCDEFDSSLDRRGFQKWREDGRRGSEHIETNFESAVMCCIRAGFDVAVHPSAGVVGSRYTAGMIRRMFPEGLPAYVRAFVDPANQDHLTPFDDLTDDRQLWL